MKYAVISRIDTTIKFVCVITVACTNCLHLVDNQMVQKCKQHDCLLALSSCSKGFALLPLLWWR